LINKCFADRIILTKINVLGEKMSDNFNLTEYLNNAIELLVSNALRSSLKNPRESAFIMKYIVESKKAEKIRIRHEKNNKHIPPFLIASITTSCNLFCTGCYSRSNNSCNETPERNDLTLEQWENIFSQAKELGISFILLAGGEPLLRTDIVRCAGKYKSIVFPVFTNGTMIDDKIVELFDKNRNLVPILSLEGDKAQTDNRRGTGTYDILTDVANRLSKKGVFYGVSITVTTENIETVTGDNFIETLYRSGCKVVFFVEYVPVTTTSKNLAPAEKERKILEDRQNKLRESYRNIIFISFPGDEKYTGGCLAAGRGFFHINADGSAEPCPFSPYSDMNLKNCSLSDAVNSPLFDKLNQTGMLLGEHVGGCRFFEKEEEVKKLIER
jgi:MoaA/NifB/PqqE/SkfB family radical SAM enzyme